MGLVPMADLPAPGLNVVFLHQPPLRQFVPDLKTGWWEDLCHIRPIPQLTAAAGTWGLGCTLYWTSHLLATLCQLLAWGGAIVAPGSVSIASVEISLLPSMFISTILHFSFEGHWSSLARLLNFISSTLIRSPMDISWPACYPTSLPQCCWHAPHILAACLYVFGLPLRHCPMHSHRHCL
jgi:hypothetical protein